MRSIVTISNKMDLWCGVDSDQLIAQFVIQDCRVLMFTVLLSERGVQSEHDSGHLIWSDQHEAWAAQSTRNVGDDWEGKQHSDHFSVGQLHIHNLQHCCKKVISFAHFVLPSFIDIVMFLFISGAWEESVHDGAIQESQTDADEEEWTD